MTANVEGKNSANDEGRWTDGRKNFEPTVNPVPDKSHTGRVGCRCNAVLGQRSACAGHAFADGAVAVTEIAVGGQGSHR